MTKGGGARAAAALPGKRLVNRRCFSLLTALVCLALAGRAASADFAAGLEAYDAGDLATAVAEWRAAATQDPEAQLALAGLYAAGEGVPEDPAEAARLYRLAAERGHPVAQLNLGELYITGRGVQRDLKQAYFWLSLAARQGRRWAALRREEIAAQMSEGARAEARAMLRTRPGK